MPRPKLTISRVKTLTSPKFAQYLAHWLGRIRNGYLTVIHRLRKYYPQAMMRSMFWFIRFNNRML